jgi:hypothetical protein
MDKPKPLRLADSLADGFGDCGAEIAAELRRLVAENERLKAELAAEREACAKECDAEYTRRPTLREMAEKEPEPEQEQEPVAYTGDVARRMREAGMTFHLGMPHAVVMEQMTRFHDIVCAEASIKAAAAFAHPPRREWQGLTDMELLGAYEAEQQGRWGDHVRSLRAVEAALKEKNA